MKTNLMKSILHLKDDTEYQIPLREAGEGDRAKVGADVAAANPEVGVKKENKTDVEDQSQDDSTVDNETEEISQEDVDDAERPALETVEEDPDETQNQEPSNTENSSNDTNTESVPQVDTAKAALDEMKKLASQEGVIHPSLFISNFSKILGLMERAMQLQVKESGSVTKESGSVTKESDSATEEKAPKATEQTETLEKTEVPEQAETPAEG